jgi:hypothetical protein
LRVAGHAERAQHTRKANGFHITMMTLLSAKGVQSVHAIVGDSVRYLRSVGR